MRMQLQRCDVGFQAEADARLHELHFVHFSGQLVECLWLEPAAKNVV
jgi:hypothetical protein